MYPWNIHDKTKDYICYVKNWDLLYDLTKVPRWLWFTKLNSLPKAERFLPDFFEM